METDREHREILAVIDQFLSNPGDVAGDSYARITRFAVDSDAVVIRLDEEVLFWMNSSELTYDGKALYLAAYIAGNIGSQLRSGEKRDDMRAGIRAVLSMYAHLEKPNDGAGVQVFEELAKLDEPGLEAHMKRMEANRPNE